MMHGHICFTNLLKKKKLVIDRDLLLIKTRVFVGGFFFFFKKKNTFPMPNVIWWEGPHREKHGMEMWGGACEMLGSAGSSSGDILPTKSTFLNEAWNVFLKKDSSVFHGFLLFGISGGKKKNSIQIDEKKEVSFGQNGILYRNHWSPLGPPRWQLYLPAMAQKGC